MTAFGWYQSNVQSNLDKRPPEVAFGKSVWCMRHPSFPKWQKYIGHSSKHTQIIPKLVLIPIAVLAQATPGHHCAVRFEGTEGTPGCFHILDLNQVSLNCAAILVAAIASHCHKTWLEGTELTILDFQLVDQRRQSDYKLTTVQSPIHPNSQKSELPPNSFKKPWKVSPTSSLFQASPPHSGSPKHCTRPSIRRAATARQPTVTDTTFHSEGAAPPVLGWPQVTSWPSLWTRANTSENQSSRWVSKIQQIYRDCSYTVFV